MGSFHLLGPHREQEPYRALEPHLKLALLVPERELALHRAQAVAALLREAGYERPISVRGYAVAPADGDGPSGRAGGRVDLLIHADGGDGR